MLRSVFSKKRYLLAPLARITFIFDYYVARHAAFCLIYRYYIAQDNNTKKLFMGSLAGYQKFLKRKRLVPEKQAPFYLRWVSSYLSFCDEEDFAPADDSHILPFLQHLSNAKEDWQVN